MVKIRPSKGADFFMKSSKTQTGNIKNSLMLIFSIWKGELFFKPIADVKKELIIITAVINILALAPTIYMLQVYDRVMSSNSIETLIVLTFVLLLIYLIQGLLEWVRGRIFVRCGNRIEYEYGEDLYRYAFANERRDGKYTVNQALGDFTNVRQFGTGAGFIAFLDAPWTPLYLALMFVFHPLIGIYSLIGGTILFILTYLNEKITKETLTKANNASMQSNLISSQNINNAEVIEALGMFDVVKEKWKTSQMEVLKFQTKASDDASNLSSVTKFIRMAMQSLILGVGAYLAIKGEISGGMIIAGSVLMGRALAPVESLIGNWKAFINARASWARLHQLVTERKDEDKEKIQLPPPTGKVRVENAIISSSLNKKPVISGVNFELSEGDVLGVIGPSGSGKSSICKALVGVWPCLSGSVRLDGADIEQYDRKFLASYLGYLPQDVEIMIGSVAENVARMSKGSDEAIIKACQIANVHDLILNLPDGYSTRIGAYEQMPLSPGQRQRIGLARAIYGGPKLVILDEPNSNLDEEGEKALEKCIVELQNSKVTVIVVSHKKSLLRYCTKLLVVAEGRQIAFGNTAEILARLAGAVKPLGA